MQKERGNNSCWSIRNNCSSFLNLWLKQDWKEECHSKRSGSFAFKLEDKFILFMIGTVSVFYIKFSRLLPSESQANRGCWTWSLLMIWFITNNFVLMLPFPYLVFTHLLHWYSCIILSCFPFISFLRSSPKPLISLIIIAVFPETMRVRSHILSLASFLCVFNWIFIPLFSHCAYTGWYSRTLSPLNFSFFTVLSSTPCL